MKIRKKHNADGKRRRFSPLLGVASLAAAALLALGISGTLAQFTASITNNNTSVQTPTQANFGFSESLNDVACPLTNPAAGNAPAGTVARAGEALDCPTINKLGAEGSTTAAIVPGAGPRTTTVVLTNEATNPGGLPANLALVVPACTITTAGAGGDLCGAVNVSLSCTGDGVTLTPIGPVPLDSADWESLTHAIASAVPVGGTVSCTFTTVFPTPSPPTSATFVGVVASQPLTWTWTSST